jgi:16S rRNA processing protein RimM
MKGLRHGSEAKLGDTVQGKPTPTDVASELQAGRVGRAHGLDGSFYVTGPRPRLLALGMDVTVAGRIAPIVRRAGTEQRPIVRLEGVEDRAAAEALRGSVLTVAEQDAPRLEEGEWWAHELEGCEVVDGEWRVGTVGRLIELPSCEALEVQREMIGSQPTGSHPPAPLLVPMVKDAIRRVDVSAGRIEVDMSFLGEAEEDVEQTSGSGKPGGGDSRARAAGAPEDLVGGSGSGRDKRGH